MSSRRYAAGTTVSVEATHQEIRRTLHRFGATAVGVIEGQDQQGRELAAVVFEKNHRRVRISLTLPDRATFLADAWTKREQELATRAWQQAVREKWRAFLLAIKNRVVSVDSGIETFEQAFLAHLERPGADGHTVGEELIPQLDAAYAQGHLPPLLPSAKVGSVPASVHITDEEESDG